jgi:hypothetical protein
MIVLTCTNRVHSQNPIVEIRVFLDHNQARLGVIDHILYRIRQDFIEEDVRRRTLEAISVMKCEPTDPDEVANIQAIFAACGWEYLATYQAYGARAAGDVNKIASSLLSQPEGFHILNPAECNEMLREIHSIMDGTEWDSETTSDIANVFWRRGIALANSDEVEDK